MVFLTRYLIVCLTLFFLINCTTQKITGPYNYMIDIVSQDSIVINKAIKESKYASSIIKIDKDDELFSVLASYDNGIEKWVTDNNISLKINQGKIVRTNGLEYDFEILGYKGFNFDLNHKNSASLLRFFDPNSGYLEIFFEYKIIAEGISKKPLSNSEYAYRLIEESFSVPLIKWKGNNYYWVDDKNNVWLTKQILNPFDKKIRIKVLKKYSG